MLLKFPEVAVLQNDSFEDLRGSLWTIHDSNKSNLTFNLDKVSVSKKNVLRGLHCDSKSWKLITCLHGKFQLVVVDFRKESKTYLQSDSIILSEDNKLSVLVPPMFANGHLVLSDKAVFFYKWSFDGAYPDVDQQYSLNWKDPSLNIQWLCDNPILSDRDKNSKFIL